ncbi:hypothetical protein [Bacillus taeanensis]|uniref:Uncharacterized protein n=1 Tax=Bacillus taeanensis TaxID=273032 RepID=A0A366XZJ8_9BACI|nr:hypothetical protein [Bacillus taeanensis]RBW71026.1 hypothetical protein DS031_03275 [Bacillus taeanensis]
MIERKYEKELPGKKGTISVEVSKGYLENALNRLPEEFSEEIAKGDSKKILNKIAESRARRF